MNNTDKEYFRLLNIILEKGRIKRNRTGIDTIGVFGEQSKFDVDLNAFPILTTKKIFFKGILHELLWFISGSTNIKYLVDNDVHIWDEWAYKRHCDVVKKEQNQTKGMVVGAGLLSQESFIQLIKDDPSFAKQWGELGEGTYGGMWRNFPVTHYYDQEQLVKRSGNGDTISSDGERYVHFVDQLQKVVDKLKTNPDDRRMIVSAWHPYWVDHCALPPCHVMFHFNTEELTLNERIDVYHGGGYKLLPKYLGAAEGDAHKNLDDSGVPRRRLNCQLYQRSCDFPLGIPFNITSYALLTAMIAHVTNMAPGTFIHTYGDAHIYVNQIEGIKEQMTREPKELPKLWLNPEVKSLFDFKYDDIKLIGYDPHPAIKMPVAV